MKTSTTAAIATITAQMIKTSKAAGNFNLRVASWAQEVPADVALDCVAADFVAEATELFTDAADYIMDVAKNSSLDAMNVGGRTFLELGFSAGIAANLTRAAVIFHDNHNRADSDYVDGVAASLQEVI